MAKKTTKMERRKTRSVSSKSQAVEVREASLAESIEAWVQRVWDDIVSFGRQLWESVKGLCAFARDLGRLTWYWLFRADEFPAERVRFRMKYFAVQIDPRELATALATSLNVR